MAKSVCDQTSSHQHMGPLECPDRPYLTVSLTNLPSACRGKGPLVRVIRLAWISMAGQPILSAFPWESRGSSLRRITGLADGWSVLPYRKSDQPSLCLQGKGPRVRVVRSTWITMTGHPILSAIPWESRGSSS